MLPFPFHFLNNNQAMNVRPKNYSWPEFYDHVIDLTRYSFSWRAIVRRFRATQGVTARWHELGAGGFDGRIWKAQVSPGNSPAAGRDPQFRPYFEQETDRASAVLRWTWCERIWGRCGSGCRKARSITIPMPMHKSELVGAEVPVRLTALE